ncbi:hypothetical protein OIDMADRAFT_57100 [Oidiodendron maius Zn]|uniref:Uncharacterized protein n=1 Tax=Oidiodendron maius (strain Zn) TaxID=913774 RepID=A0A0C3CIF0_OIDMZ|nr:hypothetical protein OIDMADRAFT_57100 [Oidiodendron maius Zn]
MESSNEVSWQSAYYALIPIALNSMLQPREPIGTTCGVSASLRIYLRSSPIVCAMDAAFILIRFAFYMHRRGRSDVRTIKGIIVRAAKDIRDTRDLVDERPRTEEDVHERPRPGRLLSSEFNTYLLYFAIVLGVVTQLLKLTAYSGGSGAIQWTQVWAGFYFGSWFVVEVIFWLAKLEDDTDLNRAEIKALERWIAPCETVFGTLAILVQLGILATVDMKPIAPDPNILSMWFFRGVRFAAHFAVFVVHIPFLKISRKIDTKQAVPGHYMGVLLIFILVPYIVLAWTQGQRFSALYFMISIMISYLSWMLYFFSWTKKWVLFCEPGGSIAPSNIGDVENRSGVQIRVPRYEGGSGKKVWQNVLAFDFFLRIVLLSAFWYVVHYDPTGTAKLQWANYLG